MTSSPRPLRVLIVEDNPARVWQIQQWLPADVRLLHAPSAGVAIGMVRRDAGHVYDGLMLDFDLNRDRAAPDSGFNGGDVVEAICRHLDPDIPVLVHSMNPTGGARMVQRLEGAGFDVTRLRMCFLDAARLGDWLQDVRDVREGLEEG